jgi:hypothetical protein
MKDQNRYPTEQPDDIESPQDMADTAREWILSEYGETAQRPAKKRFRRSSAIWALVLLIIYLLGLGSGYGLWGLPTPEEKAAKTQEEEMMKIMEQVRPVNGYTAPVRFGSMGPQMIAAGVFDISEFEKVYKQANQPLNEQQMAVLKESSDSQVVFNSQTAYFLLNYFWAVGLSNKNPILDNGPIQQYSQGKVENYASTGGWSLAKKPLKEIYSALPLIPLTAEQQKNLEEAAQAVYRPCCDNPTHFPDCNHGMAMLGLLELMASQDATVDQMLETAKHANAYWYPTQTMEQAIFFKTAMDTDYKDVDARLILGPKYSSGSGFQALHQYLGQNNLLPQSPNSGGSCGV